MATAPGTSTPIELRSWQKGLGPNYIVIFLWVVYFDQLATRTLPIGGLGPSLLGAVAGGLICYGLLYLVPATWGLKARRPLAELGASTFGEAGAALVPGLLMGIAQVV